MSARVINDATADVLIVPVTLHVRKESFRTVREKSGQQTMVLRSTKSTAGFLSDMSVVHFSPDDVFNINPFTTPACTVSELKDACTRLQTVYVPVL